MFFSRRMGHVAAFAVALTAARGLADSEVGPLPPISDPVEQRLLPSGISNLPVTLNAPRAFIFKEDDGRDALHFLGEFTLFVGENQEQELRSREAIVWITHRTSEGRAFRQLSILLWRDARIREIAGTVTTGPVLFATLNTAGDIQIEVDDVAFRPYAKSQAYQRGREIEQAWMRESDERGNPADGTMLRILNPAVTVGRTKKVKRRQAVQVRSDGELKTTEIEPGRKVLTITGGVLVSRGDAGGNRFLELRADSVVIFLPDQEGRGMPIPPRSKGDGLAPRGADRDRSREPADPSRRATMAGLGNIDVEAAYLEGDVVLSLGANQIRASRLYYDFLEDRALILDAVVHTTMLERNVPLYLRAAEIRQLSPRKYSASDAMLTTSEFYTPHYHMGARHIELTDLTPDDPGGQLRGIVAGRYRIEDATLNIGGRPILRWPHIRGGLETSETSIRNARVGYSDEFGAEIETEWHLFNLLGLETPKGFDATLHLDYFSERGPAVGVDATYERDKYFGLLRSYVMRDDGTDFTGTNREQDVPNDTRGRILLRHRHYLEDDWQLTLETSYISDENFLEEFFESEFDKGKAQETLLYLKQQRDNTALTFHLQARIMDFYSQVERFPEITYRVIGEPVGDRATRYSEYRLGIVRYRAGEENLVNAMNNRTALLQQEVRRSSGSVPRADTRQEQTWAMDVGALRIAPFVTVRGTVWDDSPDSGGLARAFGTLGVRASVYFSQVYPDVKSTLWDLDGIRHIIKPDLVAWVSGANEGLDQLYPFDQDVEGLDRADGVSIGVRQRWQTKRGVGGNRRTVDFLTLDLDVGFFNGPDRDVKTNGFTSFSRPENSLARNYASASTIFRVNDRTALLSELNYDLNDGEVDIMNVSLAVERSPRMSYLLGYRLIEETDSNLLGFEMNYQMAEKHTLAVRERFDLDRGQTLDFTIALIRKFPRWFGALSFDLDEVSDDFGVSFSIWPEGLPRAALGSRRFTGVPGNTAIRND